MCGIVGIIGKTQVNQTIYDALTVLQHRGQDAAGIVTVEQDRFRLRKANGLVKDVFQFKHMQRLQGIHGIGHVRYPTAGSSSASEAQPFYVNSPYGMTLAHNGNITNVEQIRAKLANQAKRHLNTTSDSELLLNILANELDHTHSLNLVPKDIFNAISALHQQVSGGYAVVSLLINHGMIAFRDPHGIRPLCLGSRTFDGVTEYMLASESVALDACGFEFKRDVLPGEGIYITFDGQFHSHQCAEFQQLTPCIFEYVYFARPDSFIDEVSVYAARVNMGKMLGKKILKTWDLNEIDVVIPIPETSSDIALEISQVINKPYRQGFVKNRYVGRTFIMPGQQERKKSVRRKLNAIRSEFKGKSVLLVDDSIVRGTTSQQIISMARDVGAKKVYLASAAPEIRYPNVYGIDMPTSKELIAHGRNVDEIAQVIGADGLIYQDLEDLKIAIQTENQNLKCFECSVFDGKYVTNDITPTYLERLSQDRADESKNTEYSKPSINLEMYNEV